MLSAIALVPWLSTKPRLFPVLSFLHQRHDDSVSTYPTINLLGGCLFRIHGTHTELDYIARPYKIG